MSKIWVVYQVSDGTMLALQKFDPADGLRPGTEVKMFDPDPRETTARLKWNPPTLDWVPSPAKAPTVDLIDDWEDDAAVSPILRGLSPETRSTLRRALEARFTGDRRMLEPGDA